MTANKSERLLNLVILLLVSRTYVTKEQIRGLIDTYREAGDEAFEKMFERDKDELRALGVPVELGFVDKFFEDEQGYRIKRDAFELPAIDLEPDEVAVLGLAARVWQHAGLASATSQALVKLTAAGYDVDRDALDALAPRLVAEEPAFDAMWAATLEHRAATFDYQRPGEDVPTTRHLQPWGVVTAHERWYVVGLDTDRAEPRMFRLSRVVGRVAVGPAGGYVVPEGTDVRVLTDSLAPAPPAQEATLLARPDAAHGLRRRAVTTHPGVPGPGPGPAWDRLVVPFGGIDVFAQEVLAYADAVLVESPAELRERVVATLRSVAQTAGAAGAAGAGEVVR